MNFIPGKSWLSILNEEGKLPVDRVKRYFIQIAEALKVVHANNFLHRDINPNNILIDRQDNAILIDFGNVREFIAGKSKDMTRIITPGYAPPEQYIPGQSDRPVPIYMLYAPQCMS
jgi:serine/threonine protein kinase